MVTTTNTNVPSADVEANVELVRRFYEEVVNRRNVTALSEILAPDFADHIPHPLPGQPHSGPGAMQWFIDMARAAVPDLHVAIDDIIASGDRVVVRVTWEGTQEGPLLGADPTGKKIRFMGIDIVRVDGGKIVEHWGQVDVLQVVAQLGFMPT